MPKERVKLTKRQVDGAKPSPAADLWFRDSEVPGFCLRVRPSGQKVYTLEYRPGAGGRSAPKRRYRIGLHGAPWTPDAARDEALRLMGLVKAGQDPQRDRMALREQAAEAETMAAAADRFIRQYAKQRQRSWKETARVLGLREDPENPASLTHIKGGLADPKRWGNRPMAEITKRDAIKYLSALVEADKHGAAGVSLAWLKTFWRWAWRQELVAFPIMDSLQASDFGIVAKARDRVYSDAELKALWNASENLTARESYFLRLSILMGVRRGALLGMRRSELDSTEAPTLWTVPTARTKTRKSREEEGRVYLIPISPLARRVLVPLLEASEGDPVFPSATRHGVTMDCGSPLARKIRKASGVEDWAHHAHRHTIATWLQNHGSDEYDRGLVLQHSGSGTVTSGYSHGYSLDRARKLLEKWAHHVEALVEGREDEGGNVVAIR